MNNKLNIMIGFPSTGKTTFIAALWKYLKDAKNKSFELEHYPVNREYLENIVDSWLQCESISRTITGQYEKINFTIKTTEGQCIDIEIPDIAGETYRNIFLSREIEQNLYSNLIEADGLIVFINSQLEDVSSHNRFGVVDVQEYDEGTTKKILPFSAEDIPARIQLVDILQTILCINKKKIKIAIIISAWDLIEDEITPSKWVKNNNPFLYNFIKHNFLDFQFYGISAQGGEYKEHKEELLLKHSPIERIKVCDDINCSNDITLPLQYLIKES